MLIGKWTAYYAITQVHTSVFFHKSAVLENYPKWHRFIFVVPWVLQDDVVTLIEFHYMYEMKVVVLPAAVEMPDEELKPHCIEISLPTKCACQ